MKFMSQNSLFAILLRSAWWISMLVAAALIFVGIAVVPPAYALFPICGAMPFLIISGIAAWKQRNKPSSARIEQTTQALMGMSWPAFADQLEIGFKTDGCQVKRLKTDAADFEVARPGAGRALVCARRWKAARTGIEALQRLQAARSAAGASEGIYVTLGEISAPAQAYAAKNDIRVLDAEGLTQLFRKQTVGS